MKRSDIYPEPEDGGASLPPPMKILGLHPLVWIFIVVMGIAGVAAYDHLDDVDWERGVLTQPDDDEEEEDEDPESD